MGCVLPTGLQNTWKIGSLVLEGGIKGWAAAGKNYTRLMDEYDELKWVK